ncbi:MAG TPA: integrin alpha [Myxococcota bacterium]|nr:integrin alpha [Myxococcota bacterium]
MDDDGYEDLLVGAPGYELDTSTNDKGPGAVYVFRGGD